MRSCLKIVTSEDEGKLVSTVHFIYFFRDNFIYTIVIPFLQTKKLEHRETMSCLPNQGHIANKYGTKIFKPRQYDSNTRSLNL